MRKSCSLYDSTGTDVSEIQIIEQEECCDYVSNLVVCWLPVEVARQRVLL
jgi:hypothetical protein